MVTSPLFRLCRIPVFALISLLVLSAGCSHGGKSYSPTGPSSDVMGATPPAANPVAPHPQSKPAQKVQR
jgi:hypothetical protein